MLNFSTKIVKKLIVLIVTSSKVGEIIVLGIMKKIISTVKFWLKISFQKVKAVEKKAFSLF